MSTVEETLTDRESKYGDFKAVASTAQELKAVLIRRGLTNLTADKQEALEMICTKIARILNGEVSQADSWHDIAGYALLVEQRRKM